MKLVLLVALLGVAYVAAECPEACNGHGFCGEYDKCSCYRNWQGNSCADRTCPSDIAFVDLPKGDLNMDGQLDDEITLYGAQINDIYAFEVYPTDGYQINRASDDSSTGDVMYTTLTANEKAASFYDQAEDGHFYAECSNKGMCDRKSGQCDCFDGYSGTACRRVACPNDCSGHGTCETIAETSADGASYTYQLWDRYKTQVCSCDPGYFGIDCAQRHCPYGDDPLSADQYNEVQWLTLRTHGDGTNGPTGSGALTPTGTFRLAYKDEYGETWNTSPISAMAYSTSDNAVNTAQAAAIKAALEGIPNSVFEEVEVELWPIQTPLPGAWNCDGSKCDIHANAGTNHKLLAASMGGLGQTSEQTSAADVSPGGFSAGLDLTSSVLTGGTHKWGVSTCFQTGHTSAEFATGVTFRGGTCANAACGTGSEACATDLECIAAGEAWTYSGEISNADITTNAAAILCRYDMNGFRAKITFTTNPGDINELTCDADLVTTAEHSDSNAPSTDIVCTAKDRLNLELGAVNTVIGSTIGGGNGGQIQTNMDLSQTMDDGDRIVFTVSSTVNTCTIAGPVTPGTDTNLAVIICEEEFAATAALTSVNAPAAHWLGKGTTENTECSHRGLCNHDEGLCECFTGYTHDDCSRQDALNA